MPGTHDVQYNGRHLLGSSRGNCPPFEDYDIDATESRRRRDSVTSRGVVERVKEETMTRLGTKRRNRHGGKYQA